jgi:tetratricopeptide (TPR) repeat protein
LWDGSRLEQVLELKKDPIFNQILGFNQEENKFITISKKRRDRERYRAISLLVAYSLIVTISLIVLVSLFGSRFFNDWGFKDYTEGEFKDYTEGSRQSYQSAIQKYTIAIVIGSKIDISTLLELKKNPYQIPLYNRGLAYERSGDFAAASADYKESISTNPNFALAYNNLAYLNILNKKNNNYSEAIKEAIKNLEIAQKLHDKDPVYKAAEYPIFKNLGWAQFELAHLNINAEVNLRNAINLNSKGGAAYCLLAQLLESKKPINAKNEWENCIEHGDDTRPEQKEWMDLAKKHLKID